MAKEFSPYEGTFDRVNGKTALGKIVAVDIKNRRCRVKTLGQKGVTDDQDLLDVQWLATSTGDVGEEDASIPKVGQTAVITYINSEPYVTGYFRGLPTAPADLPPDYQEDPEEDLLNQGDKVIKTTAGNRLLLRTGGTVEVESTKLCRTYWLPSNNTISDVCANYELETDGGFMTWIRDEDTDNTQLSFFVFDKQSPSYAVDLQFGTTDTAKAIEVSVGPVSSGLDFTEKKFSLTVESSGKTTLNVGAGKSIVEIDAASGSTSVTTQGDLKGTSQKKVLLEGAGGAKLSLNEGKVALGAAAAELLDLVDQILGAIPQITVPTLLGPSGPPLNAAAFASIKSKLAGIKGSL